MGKREYFFKKFVVVMLVAVMACSTFTGTLFAKETGNTTAKTEQSEVVGNSEKVSTKESTAKSRALPLISSGKFAREVWIQVLKENGKGDTAIDVSYANELAAFNGKLDFNGVVDAGSISGFQGLSNLTNLTELDLTNTNPRSLDLSENTKLKKLVLKNNTELQGIDLSKNINLEDLHIEDSNVSALDLSDNLKLKTLELIGMGSRLNTLARFEELILGDKPSLTTFTLTGGALSTLDLSGEATNLTDVSIGPQFVSCGMIIDNNTFEVEFNMKYLVGVSESNLSNVQMVLKDNDTYNSTTGKLHIDGNSMHYHPGDEKETIICPIHYKYDTGGIKENGEAVQLETYVTDEPINPLNPKPYTVTFMDLNGKPLQPGDKYKAGESVTPPTAPTRDGYDFIGWDKSIDYVVKSMDVYPIYEPQATTTVSVIFQDYNGNKLQEIELLAGKGVDAADVPIAPKHEGFSFIKWDKSYKKINTNTTITAVYEMQVFKDIEFRKIIWNKVLNDRPNDYDSSDTTYKIYSSDLGTISEYNKEPKGDLFLNTTSITDLSGIEYFKTLDYLDCHKMLGLKSVDLSQNIALKMVSLNDCALETLTLGILPDLRILRCEGNQLKRIDVSGCPSLGLDQISGNEPGELVVRNNQLEKNGLKLGTHNYLTSIYLDNNPNQGIIDVKGCPELITLSSSNTGLTAINVTNNLKLENLNVDYNNLQNLDVTKNTKLKQLTLIGGREGFTSEAGNKVTELNLQNNVLLDKLYCSFNGIASLDVTYNQKLRFLNCAGNKLTELDLKQAKELLTLQCSSNKLSTLDVSTNTKLQDLNCAVNLTIKELDLRRNTELTTLICHYNGLEKLDLTNQTKLKTLSCSDNQLYRLDISANAFQEADYSINIDSQMPRTIHAGPSSTAGKFEYDISKIVGTDTSKTKISMEGLTDGSYESTSGKIIFDSTDVTTFGYRYATGNAKATPLKVLMIPQYGTFYKVSFVDDKNELKNIEVLEGGKVVKPMDIPAPRTGWEFEGWYKDEKLTQEWDFDSDTVREETKIYAKWIQKEYKVDFSTGTSPIPELTDVKYGNKLNNPKTPIILGKQFEGWYKDNAYQNEWNFDTDIITQDVTLFAKWKDKKYIVKYETKSEESSETEKIDVRYHESSLLPNTVLTRTGYIFAGWKYGTKVVTQSMEYGQLVDSDGIESITLTAQWTPHLFTIHYDTGYHDIVVANKANVTWDDANLLPQTPKKHGYQLKSWTLNGKEVALTDKYRDLTTDSTSGTSLTLLANWSERDDYSVSYNSNNGILPQGTPLEIHGLKYTSPIQLPTPTREGYIFEGWIYQDVIAKDKALYSDFDKSDTANKLELKAVWRIMSYAITFDYVSQNNPEGLNVFKVNVDYGNKVSQPVFISLENWGFDGWYVDRECTHKFDFNTAIKSDQTLYGKWVFIEPIKPNPGGVVKPEVNESPKTSDNYNYMFYSVMLLLSIVCVDMYKKKKTKL